MRWFWALYGMFGKPADMCAPTATRRRSSLLRHCSEIGPGHVHRACVGAQRLHFDPPQLAVGAPSGLGKYR
jgi:hypothetical protein